MLKVLPQSRVIRQFINEMSDDQWRVRVYMGSVSEKHIYSDMLDILSITDVESVFGMDYFLQHGFDKQLNDIVFGDCMAFPTANDAISDFFKEIGLTEDELGSIFPYSHYSFE